MKRVFAVFSLIVAAFFQLNAQSPYWQQSVDYIIDVQLDDQRHMLLGQEQFIYHNKSPHSLDRLYIHLWPNAYRDRQTAFARQQLNNNSWRFYNAPDSLRGFIDSLDFQVNKQAVKWSLLSADTPDVAVIWLNKPLAPGQRITVSTPFRVKIPGDFSRMGRRGQQYQLTQWYPKPAVYDAQGWHYMPYLDLGEFYSDFGSFEVNIRVPENYRVAASGDLQTASERNWLDSLAEAAAAMDSFPRLEREKSAIRYKSLRYTLDQVHDFAWFAGKDYYVKKSEVFLPNSGRKVQTYAFFVGGITASYWSKAAMFVDSSVYYYSQWLGDYPYQQCTAVQGALSAGGGMEYPTITVISAGGSAESLDEIVAHEVGHNWFYGILASNERAYPWLDEGLNSYYEWRYMKQRYGKVPGFEIDLPVIDIDEMADADQLTWLISARRGNDVALWNTPSHHYNNETYGTQVYKKTAVYMKYLAAYLGQEEFDSRMQAYYRQWKFKHPQPADFKAAMKQGKGDKTVDWWFDLLHANTQVDYRIRSVKKTADNNYKLRIAGLGANTPFVLAAFNDSGELIRKEWFAGFSGVQNHQLLAPNAQRFVIDPAGDMPLYMRPRNAAKVGSWLPAFPAIKPLAGINIAKNKAYLLPIVGYNVADGGMFGLGLYSSILLPQDLEYAVLPMYGIRSGTLAGSARIRYHWFPQNGPFGRMQAGITAKRYATFVEEAVIQYHIQGRFRKLPAETLEKDWQFRIAQLWVANRPDWVPTLSMQWKQNRLRNPWQVKVSVWHWQTQQNNQRGTLGPLKSSTRFDVSAYHRWHMMPAKKMWLDQRVFAGIASTSGNGYVPIFAGNNSVGGQADFLTDAVFFDRGPNSRQIMLRDAGLRVANPGYSAFYLANVGMRWLSAYNLAFKLSKLPLELFADFSFSEINLNRNLGGSLPAYEPLTYDAGIALTLGESGFFKLNFPLLLSPSLRRNNFVVGTPNFAWHEQISFSIDLFKLNPYDLVRDLKF